MGKFNASQRETIGTNCVGAVQSSGNKKRVMVYCASKEAGQLVATAIQAAYPNYTVTKSENVFESILTHVAWGALGPIGTAAGIATETWKNFSVNTGSQSNAKKLVTEIGECIDAYGNGATFQGLGDVNGNTGGSGNSKTAVYIIAGAVIVVIAILLIRKKK